mmetsp:Transcript_21761/g.38283  ORF Transcript_21761/g.38283 Transcript_21761/m.38283 type:complete len:118 (+) Transcript_21761:246-599(+)
MGEEVKLRLIYANNDTTQEITTTMNTSIRDVKKNIMENHWPESINTAIENVERLRLFAGGRELGGKDADDNKSLKDAKLAPSTNFTTPVHVVSVLKSTEATCEKEQQKPSQCFCALL